MQSTGKKKQTKAIERQCLEQFSKRGKRVRPSHDWFWQMRIAFDTHVKTFLIFVSKLKRHLKSYLLF